MTHGIILVDPTRAKACPIYAKYKKGIININSVAVAAILNLLGYFERDCLFMKISSIRKIGTIILFELYVYIDSMKETMLRANKEQYFFDFKKR